MGCLIDYFMRLKEGDEIEKKLLDTIRNVDTNTNSILHSAPRFRNHFISLDDGISVNTSPYTYLPWIERAISYCKINPDYDVISLPFSGCYFAKVRYMDETYRAFHIQTDTNPVFSRKEDWNSYMGSTNDIKDVIIFNPFDDKHPHMTWGIISNDNKCFSIFVDFVSNEGGSVMKYKFIGMTKRERRCEIIR